MSANFVNIFNIIVKNDKTVSFQKHNYQIETFKT